MNHECRSCQMSFKTSQYLQQHLKCKRHTDKIKQSCNPKYQCSVCQKTYTIRQSLHAHTKSKCCAVSSVAVAISPATTIPNPHENLELKMDEMKQAFEKERQEMKAQIAMLLDKHAGPTTNNNIIETQNINIININAFGNENTDYLDDKAILACIGRVYKSIPSLLEKIHFDPQHPENHNIKITNKKLPYASVMGNNHKWKTVDRKDAIESMVLNSYNMLDERYTDNKEKFSTQKQDNFEGFQSKFESDDRDLMKQIKTEVDMMVLNGV